MSPVHKLILPLLPLVQLAVATPLPVDVGLFDGLGQVDNPSRSVPGEHHQPQTIFARTPRLERLTWQSISNGLNSRSFDSFHDFNHGSPSTSSDSAPPVDSTTLSTGSLSGVKSSPASASISGHSDNSPSVNSVSNYHSSQTQAVGNVASSSSQTSSFSASNTSRGQSPGDSASRSSPDTSGGRTDPFPSGGTSSNANAETTSAMNEPNFKPFDPHAPASSLPSKNNPGSTRGVPSSRLAAGHSRGGGTSSPASASASSSANEIADPVSNLSTGASSSLKVLEDTSTVEGFLGATGGFASGTGIFSLATNAPGGLLSPQIAQLGNSESLSPLAGNKLTSDGSPLGALLPSLTFDPLSSTLANSLSGAGTTRRPCRRADATLCSDTESDL